MPFHKRQEYAFNLILSRGSINPMKFKHITIIFLTGLITLFFTVSAFAGVQFIYPKFQAFDNNGDPLSGGKLYTFAANSSTAKPVYHDKALTTPWTPYVLLNSRGEAVIYGAGSYKFVLYKADGSLIWTFDYLDGIGGYLGGNFYFPDAGQADQGVAVGSVTVKDFVDAIGATKTATIVFSRGSTGNTTDYTFLTAETITSNITCQFEQGARIAPALGITVTLPSPANIIAQPNQQIFSGAGTVIFSFGETAYPNWWATNTIPGTTNMTAAVQAAISSGVGSVYFLKEIYAVSQLTLVSNQRLHGIGPGSILNPLTSIGAGGIFNGTTITNVEIDSLKFTGINRPLNNNPAEQDGDRGISFQTCTNINVHDNEVSGFWSFGIVASGCTKVRIHNNYVHDIGNQSGIAISNTSSNFTVSNNIVENIKLYGIELENTTTDGTVVGNSIKNCVAGISINYSTARISVVGNTIRSCNNVNTISGSTGVGLFLNGPISDITITGNIITDNNTNAVTATGNLTSIILNGNFFKNGTTTNPLVTFTGATSVGNTDIGITFTNNILDGKNAAGTSVSSPMFLCNYEQRMLFKGNRVKNAGAVIFSTNGFGNSVIEMPELTETDALASTGAEVWGSVSLTNIFYSPSQSEQYLPLVGTSSFSRDHGILKASKVVGIYWCVNANNVTGTWNLEVNGGAVSAGNVATLNKEKWFFSPLNYAVVALGTININIANSADNTYGKYVKYRLVTM